MNFTFGDPELTPNQDTLVKFTFHRQPIRTVLKGDDIWFVAKDICNILGVRNPAQALTRLDEDDRQLVILPTPLGLEKMLIIDEWGVFKLIDNCRIPEGKHLKRWLTHEVLPWIYAQNSTSQKA